GVVANQAPKHPRTGILRKLTSARPPRPPKENRLRLSFHRESHTAGRAGDDAGSVLDVAGIQVGHFLLGDVGDLRLRDLEPLVLALRLLLGRNQLTAFFLLQWDPGGLLEEYRRGRALGLEGEGAVREDRNDDRHGDAAQVLGPLVELRDELSDVHAV